MACHERRATINRYLFTRHLSLKCHHTQLAVAQAWLLHAQGAWAPWRPSGRLVNGKSMDPDLVEPRASPAQKELHAVLTGDEGYGETGTWRAGRRENKERTRDLGQLRSSPRSCGWECSPGEAGPTQRQGCKLAFLCSPVQLSVPHGHWFICKVTFAPRGCALSTVCGPCPD